MPYLTPSLVTPATEYWCRRLVFPADFDLLIAIKGAILELTKSYNWEKFGTSEPRDIAKLMQVMYDDFVFSGGCMIGMILPYITVYTPPNTLPCDGSQHDRVDYPMLYHVLPPPLIVDADHFITPDLRDKFFIGAGGEHIALTEGGAKTVTLTANQMPVHTHTTQPHVHGESIAVPTIINGGVEAPASAATPGAGTTGTATVIVDDAGGGEAHENRPPFIALPYLVIAR